MVEQGLAKGGPRGGMELFVRVNAGDTTFEGLDPDMRERMLANGEIFFSHELEAFVSYVPEAAALARVRVPVVVVAGADNRDLYYYEAAQWVADRIGTPLRELPGAHVPYLDRPEAFVAALRPFLRELPAV